MGRFIKRTPQHEADRKRELDDSREDRFDISIFCVSMITILLTVIAMWQSWF